MRTRLTRPATAVLAAGLLVLTAACGGSGSGTTATSSGSTSPSPSAESTDSGTTGDVAALLTRSDLGSKIRDAQQKAGSYTFTITTALGGRSSKGSGEASISGDQPSVHSTMETPGGAVETVLVDGLYYLKSPMLRSDKPWLKIDPKAKTGMGALIGKLGGNGDPSKSLGALFDASKVTKAGEESIGGHDTVHYKVVMPRAALAKAIGYPASVVQMLPKELVYGLWVDGDNLVRKIESSLTLQGQTTVTTIMFDHYGEPVSIKTPPASEVTTKSPLGA